MRVFQLALAILALVSPLTAGRGSLAHAASFEAEVRASQEAENGSSNSSDVESQTTTESPAGASLTFSGASAANGVQQRRGTTNASGTADVTFDENGLEMGVFSRSRASAVTDGLGPLNYRATSSATATFIDAITIVGGEEGETGYVRAVFKLDGTVSSTSINSAKPVSQADLLITFNDSGPQLFSLSHVNGQPASGFPPQAPPEITIYFKYHFGIEAPFAITMLAQTFAALETTISNVTQTVDFASTLKFVSAEILDKDFVPVLGADIISASGLQYPYGPLDHIELEPADATIQAGQSQAYTARGFDSNGHDLGNVNAITTFSIDPDGQCTGASCRATVAGPHTVTADAGVTADGDPLTATANLQVDPGPLHHLVLSPSSATITAGGTQAYTAEGFDAFDNSRGDVTGSTTFSMSPNGSCTGAVCGATAAGAHTVTGNDSGKVGTASLTVDPGPLDHITIAPASVTTTPGGSQTYTAAGFDEFNNSLGNVTGSTAFSIAPDGSCVGATCSATQLGVHTVTGANGGAQANASFTVVPGPPRPDLVVTNVGNPPATMGRFGRITGHDTVANQGTLTSGAANTRYYLSKNKTKGASDTMLFGQRTVGPLAPGQSSAGQATLFVFGVQPGSYFLLACADDRLQNAEIDEGNNCLASATKVTIQ